MRSIVWFREDLRVQDNPALFEAVEASIDGVVGLYIIDESTLRRNHTAACRVEFILRGVASLSETLSSLYIPLLIRTVKTTEEIPEVILKVMEDVKAKALYCNHQYEQHDVKRDAAVQSFLAQSSIKMTQFHDQVVLKPRNEHSKTFTAFKKLWIKQFVQQGSIKLLPSIYEQRALGIASDSVPSSLPGFSSSISPDLWPTGEEVALKQLRHFAEHGLSNYDKIRDYPSIEGTSQLSPYLAAGMISPRQCFLTALESNDSRLGDGNEGAIQWMNELIWRDFYKHIVITVPRVCDGEAYQQETQEIVWDFDQAMYDAWINGYTGFPIIDSAMRQLREKGWMHTRLRIITATFFCKYMFFDWRVGERYFMEQLIDGDFAANNGGWQWCASTGTDASAYFRYFDPIRQSDRYDPEGVFIKKYCHELSDMSQFAIHLPYTRARAQAEKTSYPRPILDLKESRAKANEKFREGVKKK